MFTLTGFFSIITLLPNRPAKNFIDIYVLILVMFVLFGLRTYMRVLNKNTSSREYRIDASFTSYLFAAIIVLLLFYPLLDQVVVQSVQIVVSLFGVMDYAEIVASVLIFIGFLLVFYRAIARLLYEFLTNEKPR